MLLSVSLYICFQAFQTDIWIAKSHPMGFISVKIANGKYAPHCISISFRRHHVFTLHFSWAGGKNEAAPAPTSSYRATQWWTVVVWQIFREIKAWARGQNSEKRYQVHKHTTKQTLCFLAVLKYKQNFMEVLENIRAGIFQDCSAFLQNKRLPNWRKVMFKHSDHHKNQYVKSKDLLLDGATEASFL